MKCSIILLLCVWISQFVLAQQRDPSIILYDRGNAAVARKDYRTADSLFTLSLNLAPHPDSYYNRAVCRRQLNDFKGYCLDLNSASDLGDRESNILYSKQCVKFDTIYKKISGDPALKIDYEIVEYLKTYKYSTDFDYEKLDSSKKLILSKIRRNNEIIYKHCSEVKTAKHKVNVDTLINYIKTQTNYLETVRTNELAGHLKVSVMIDEKGHPKNPVITFGEYDKITPILFKELFDSLKWNPARYNDRMVKSMIEISITYYENELTINSPAFLEKDEKEVLKSVEVMPDFKGGPIEMMRFLHMNIIYPQRAKEAGLSGKCFLRYVVLPNGSISNVEVLKGIKGCPECDAEAVRVVKAMPKWKPGTQNGKPVPVFFNLPINFQLR